jgi:hypothetical protein
MAQGRTIDSMAAEILTATVNENGCWIGRWRPGKNGYVSVSTGRRGSNKYLHVIAFEWSSGPLMDGHRVIRTCENRACCNPNHLIAVAPLTIESIAQETRRLNRDAEGCWSSSFRPDSNGYVKAYVDGKKISLHRLMYESEYGSVPEGMELDHVCHTEDPSCPGGNSCLHRRCCNPWHLEPVTHRENVLRGRSPGQLADWQASRTPVATCKYGHPYEGWNLILRKDRNGRECRECLNRRNRESASRRKAGE